MTRCQLLRRVATVCLTVLLSACGGGSHESTCLANLLAGDLVITEIMANPLSSDEGKEWFEIYNHTSSSLDLTGVQVASARADGSGEQVMVIGGATTAAGDYYVLGGMVSAVKPAYVDYPYGAALGGLRNSSGKLILRCGKALIDEVIYLEAKDGLALQFDGSLQPDAAANDDSLSWCDARVEYEAGSFGSPGAPNTACGNVPPTSCKEGENVRDIVAPHAGDLIITEFMSDPTQVADNTGEWIEVYVTRNVDLNGLKLGASAEQWKDQVVALECVPAAAGTHLVFARTTDGGLNGGLPRADGTFSFTLANSAGSAALGFGDELIDAVTWNSTHAGASSALEPTLTDPTENDNPDYWCAGSAAYGAGDLGTPGAPNPSCGITPAGKCSDGGNLRDQRLPAAGDLVISEIMSDPSQVTDAVGEWFEVYVARDLDLNRLQVGKTQGTVDFTLPGGECLAVAAGSHVIFAASLDSGENGGLPRADYLLSFGLTNSGGSLFVGFDGTLLDAVTYTAATAGTAWSLSSSKLDPAENDLAANWCPAAATYGAGDHGTPGGANPSCP